MITNKMAEKEELLDLRADTIGLTSDYRVAHAGQPAMSGLTVQRTMEITLHGEKQHKKQLYLGDI